MVVKKKTKEVKAPPGQEKEKTYSNEDFKVGYAVGMTPEGEFVFQVFGKDTGLVELLGIHRYGGMRVKQIFESKQMTGDALVHEVGKAVRALNLRIDQLIGSQTKPNNEL